MILTSTKQTFLQKFEAAMQNMRYDSLLPEARSLFKQKKKDNEIANAYATLLDHQAVLEQIFVRRIWMEWQAKRLYKKVLKRDNKNIDAWSGLGRIYWHHSNPKAIRYYQKALHLDPDNPIRHGNLANSYARVGKKEKANIIYRQAMKMPNAPFTIYLNFFRNTELSLENAVEIKQMIKTAEDKISNLHNSTRKNLAREQLNEIKNRISDAGEQANQREPRT